MEATSRSDCCGQVTNRTDGNAYIQPATLAQSRCLVSECTELMQRLQLQAEYYELTGKALPEYIRRLPIDKLRLAIQQARAGVVFGEWKELREEDSGSLMDWDRQDDKNGNAYG